MPFDGISTEVRTQRDRYKYHRGRGDGIFEGRRSQLEIRSALSDYFHEIDPDTERLNNAGYFVAPPRIGKTIIGGDYIVGINTMPNGEYVLRDPTRRKRVLITVPTNLLVDQWADRLLGEMKPDGTRAPGIFGDLFKEEDICVYHADKPMTDAQKREMLGKPVVIMTNGSVLACTQHTDKAGKPDPFIRGEDFHTLLADEVDKDLRGDVHSQVFKDTFFGKSLIIGMTATQLYRSGKSVGDYLFGGKKPICEITHKEAIDRLEIAPNVTITYEPEVDRLESDIKVLGSYANRWESLNDQQKEWFIKQTGSDNAAIEIIGKGTHPKTGVKLRELKQLWKGETIEHSKLFARKLNEAFGAGRPADEPYAAVVYGTMPPDEAKDIFAKYKAGKIKALVQCKYIGRGFDDADIELTGSLAPSQSPNDLIQFFTRADTRRVTESNGKTTEKIAVHLTPRIPGIDQLHIGELLGGQIMIPKGWEFPPTSGKSRAEGEPEPWPDIQGVKVYYTTEQTEQLAEILKRERYINGLPEKTAKTLTLQEMAKQLNIDEDTLAKRVYEPLRRAYDVREARDKFIELGQQDDNNVIHVNGCKFPVSRIGYRHDKRGNEHFCIDGEFKNVAQRALYGRLDPLRPELLTQRIAQKYLKVSEGEMDALWKSLQEAFFNRPPYAQSLEIGGIKFPYKDFNFYLDKEGKPAFLIAPDTLLPARRHFTGESEAQAQVWMKSTGIKTFKTAEWLTATDIAKELSLYGDKANELLDIFVAIHSKTKGMKAGEEREISIPGRRSPMKVALKYLPLAPFEQQDQICMHRDDLEWLKSKLGFEYNADAIETSKRAGKRR